MSSGQCRWLIPDMFWPASSAEGVCVSHEAICVLPVYTCGAKRTKHIRLDAALDGKGEHIPRGTGYAAEVVCSVPVVVQYTRVDATQAANSLMTTMAYPLE